MNFLRSSVLPGTAVAFLLEVLAVLYLGAHGDWYTGNAATWQATVVLWALFPAATLVLLFVPNRHGALGVLMLKATALFWGTVAEGALLPARWLAFAALLSLATTVLPGRWKIAAALVFLGEYLLISHVIPGMVKDGPDPVVWGIALVLVLLPALLLTAMQRALQSLERLDARNDELHASVMQLTSVNTEFLEQATTAGEESAVLERHRITRDLHDVVGQTLTNIIMMMDASLHRKVHEPDETVKLLKWIRKQAQTGLEETRGVLYELRALKQSRLRGLKALKKLIETFSRLSRIRTRVEWGNLPWTFDLEQENAVYHLVQGSLSNAFRHGLATRIDLHFQIDRGVLQVMIRDNGRGGPDTQLGLGQRGMEERLTRWGGTVTFRNEPYGYVVNAALPLVEDRSEAVQDSHR